MAVVVVIDVEIWQAVGSWEARPALLVINHVWLALVSHKHCNDAWAPNLVCSSSLQLVFPVAYPCSYDVIVEVVLLFVVWLFFPDPW